MAKPRKRLGRSSRHPGTIAEPVGLAEDASQPQQLFAGRVKTPADPRHAFFAERDLDRASAQFWIEAYQLIVGTRK